LVPLSHAIPRLYYILILLMIKELSKGAEQPDHPVVGNAVEIGD
jgi:hypothetical protein